MWEIRDEYTEKVLYVGTYEQCLQYSKDHPNINFIMTEANKPKFPKSSAI